MKWICIIWLLLPLVARSQNWTTLPFDSAKSMLARAVDDTSRVNALNACFYHLGSVDYDSARRYADEAFQIARRTGYKKGLAGAYYNLGLMESFAANFAKASTFFYQSLRLNQELNAKEEQAEAQFQIGCMQQVLYNYPAAFEHYFAALRLFEAEGKKQSSSKTLVKIGEVYHRLGNLQVALQYYEKGLAIKKSINDEARRLTYVYIDIARAHRDMNNYAGAFKNFSIAIDILKDSFDITNAERLCVAYTGIGDMRATEAIQLRETGHKKLARQKFSEAIHYYHLSMDIGFRIADSIALTQNYSALAMLYAKFGDDQKAVRYIAKTLAGNIKMQKFEILRNIYGIQAAIDSAKGDFKNAYRHYQLHILYRDSMVTDEAIRQSEGYRVQSDFDRKEDEIRLLSTQHKVSVALAAKHRQQKLIAWIGAVFLLFAGAYVFYRYKKKKKLQSEQAVMSDRFRISRELHDEVGATLSGVAMYSHLAKSQLQHDHIAQAEKSLQVIRQSSAEMVNKLNDIVWLVNPDQDSLQKLVEKLEEYTRNMAAIKNIQVVISVPAKLEEKLLPIESRRNIYLFCKEAVNNAVKYSGATQLHLSIRANHGRLEFSVTDNGKGFDTVMVRRGNGLDNMQKRADTIGAQLSLRSKYNEGAQLSLTVEIPQ